MVISQFEEGCVSKKEGKTTREPLWGRNRGNPMVIHQALGGKYKEWVNS